jgi:hypothetical protein
MINALGIWNNWVSLSSQAAMLPLRTQSVIALGLMRIAGGALARSEAEATRMGTEKVQALGDAQLVAPQLVAPQLVASQLVAPVEPMTGRHPRRIAKKSMASRNRRIAKKSSMARRNRRHIAKKVAGVYKKRVRGNRRRLTR